VSERISTEQGFVDYFLRIRPNKNDFLDKVEVLIDWRPIEKLLKRHYRKVESADGRPAYPPLPMFKMLLLQRWYNLSDPALEAAMYDRISFIRFVGLSFDSSVPDETTICRFRNALKDSGLHKQLLRQINKQLQKQQLLVRDGAIVDATIVSSCRRPRKVIEVVPEDRREEEAEGDDGPGVKVEYSDDEDARWIKKGKRSTYGYKAHIATDANGFVLCGHATGANRSDTREFERVVNDAGLPEGAAVLADKGYAGAPNRDVLAQRHLGNGIMSKASRGSALSPLAKLRNRIISGHRFVVEQSTGIMKRHYGFSRARYKGIGKVELELHLIAMALNIKKGVGLSFA
jgi:transposase, IS5 family